MEIISYVGASRAKKTRASFFSKVIFPKFGNFKKRTRPYEFGSAVNAVSLPKIHPLLILKKLGKYFWTVPLFVTIALVPYAVNKAFSMMQTKTNPLVLKNEKIDEMAFLQEAMSRLALSTGDEVDADGNVAGSDVSLALFQDKVTYKDYIVKSGETIGGITSRFGLKNISTIIAVNEIENVRQVFQGRSSSFLRATACFMSWRREIRLLAFRQNIRWRGKTCSTRTIWILRNLWRDKRFSFPAQSSVETRFARRWAKLGPRLSNRNGGSLRYAVGAPILLRS